MKERSHRADLVSFDDVFQRCSSPLRHELEKRAPDRCSASRMPSNAAFRSRTQCSASNETMRSNSLRKGNGVASATTKSALERAGLLKCCRANAIMAVEGSTPSTEPCGRRSAISAVTSPSPQPMSSTCSVPSRRRSARCSSASHFCRRIVCCSRRRSTRSSRHLRTMQHPVYRQARVLSIEVME